MWPTASISKSSRDLDKISIIIAYVEFLVFKCHAFGNISISIDRQRRGFAKDHNMKLQEFSGMRKTQPLLTPQQLY